MNRPGCPCSFRVLGLAHVTPRRIAAGSLQHQRNVGNYHVYGRVGIQKNILKEMQKAFNVLKILTKGLRNMRCKPESNFAYSMLYIICRIQNTHNTT